MPDTDAHRLYAEIKELGVKIDNLTDLFNHAAHGDGFPRCASHERRILHMEKNVELCHERIGSVKKWLVAGLVSVMSMLANFVWNVIQSGTKH